jgi:hypothetical protein
VEAYLRHAGGESLQAIGDTASPPITREAVRISVRGPEPPEHPGLAAGWAALREGLARLNSPNSLLLNPAPPMVFAGLGLIQSWI